MSIESRSQQEYQKNSPLEEAITASEQLCQTMKFDLNSWHGVPPRADREEGVRLDTLAGFAQDIKELDRLRWSKFRAAVGTKLLDHAAMVKLIAEAYVLKPPKIFEPPIWIEAAVIELPAFFSFLRAAVPIQDYSQMHSLITPPFISDLVKGFLVHHVGEGENRVHHSSFDGFDGVDKTCPVSLVPTKGMRYFSFACAEYLLMMSIEKQFGMQ
jgi:hypothetical protein